MKIGLKIILPIVLLMGTLLANLPPLLAQGTVDEIERLLRAGQAQRAFEQALQRSEKESGNPRFDLLFARAALAAAHPEHAVFALERVLAQQPGNLPAWLDLARAELALGNGPGTRRALEALLARHPPEPLRLEALALAQQLDLQSRVQPSRLRAHAELKSGHDTNINTASTLTSVTLYTTSQPTSVSTTAGIKDYYGQVDLGVETDKPLDGGRLLFGAISGYVRDNFHSDTYDTRSVDVRTGTAWAIEQHLLRLSAQWQRLDLDGIRYRTLWVVIPEWGYRLTTANQLVLFGQFGAFDYPGQDARNADLLLGGTAWVHRFSRSSQLALSLYHGEEKTGDDNSTTLRRHLARDYTGGRVRGQTAVTATHSLYLSAAGQRAEHAAADPLFLTVREDSLYIGETGWHWKLAPQLTLKTELSYNRNNSNIPLYDYRRRQFQLSLRYSLH
jgi:hypothetical protein